MKMLFVLLVVLVPWKVTFADDAAEMRKLIEAQREAIRATTAEPKGDHQGTRTYHERRAERLLREVESARDSKRARGAE